MRSIKIAVIIAALALFIIACDSSQPSANSSTPAASPSATAATASTPAPAASPADELADARATFKQICARCHKEDGSGGEFKDESGTLKVPNLREGHAVSHTDERLAKKIANGGDGMPAFSKRLSPERINNLVRYIRVEIQGKK
jgi:mono/diheme cytochrome c family protein